MRLTKRVAWTAAAGLVAVVAATLVTGTHREVQAGPLAAWSGKHGHGAGCCAVTEDGPPIDEVGGTWYWLRSPEEEKRVVASLYNRYCIRCHGADGRGVWDIPDVPNFTNAAW
jgi:hypothetical protein